MEWKEKGREVGGKEGKGKREGKREVKEKRIRSEGEGKWEERRNS